MENTALYESARTRNFSVAATEKLLASIFPYSKQKSTYTCCLCEVHSVLKEKKGCLHKQLFCCPVRARSQQLFYHRNFLVASARLALVCGLWRFVSDCLIICTVTMLHAVFVVVGAFAELRKTRVSFQLNRNQKKVC
jgi:hypothetical protein